MRLISRSSRVGRTELYLAAIDDRSRWKDERFWPAFCDALRREHPILTEAALGKAKEFNSQRYYYQGIGRYAPAAAYARGLADLQVLANLIPADGYVHGPKPTSIDAAIYGFIANIYFYEIDTPLRQFVASHPNLVRHCTTIDATIGSEVQVDVEKKPHSTNWIDLLARALPIRVRHVYSFTAFGGSGWKGVTITRCTGPFVGTIQRCEGWRVLPFYLVTLGRISSMSVVA